MTATSGRDRASTAGVGEGASILSVVNVNKSYGGSRALDDVSFACPAGSITGLLGPNGSGKSTTLRILLGLARADSGQVLVGGRPYAELQRPANVAGVLLDASAQHAGRTVRETTALAGMLAGVDSTRVDQCLETVGLGAVRRRRVGALSLGMRQRLGLAIALLGAPRLLILDEPGNGLDPEGLAWLNDFLARFAAAGGTVLVSSHHLTEIESIATDVVVLDRGRVAYAGPATAITHDAARSIVCSADDSALARVIAHAGFAVESKPGIGLVADAAPEVIGRLALNAGIALTALGREEGRIQRFFLDNTNGEYQGRHDDLMALTEQGAAR